MVRRRKPRRKISAKKRAQISRKIRILMREGYPQRQAIAIAYRMAGVPRKRKHARRKQSHTSRLRKRRHYYARTVKPRRARIRRHVVKAKKYRKTQYQKWVSDYNDELERRHPGYRYTV